MTLLIACPMCGKSSTQQTFNPLRMDDDIYVQEMRGLGRGRGFARLNRRSAIDDVSITTPIVTRSLDLVEMLLGKGVISNQTLVSRFGLQTVVIEQVPEQKINDRKPPTASKTPHFLILEDGQRVKTSEVSTKLLLEERDRLASRLPRHEKYHFKEEDQSIKWFSRGLAKSQMIEDELKNRNELKVSLLFTVCDLLIASLLSLLGSDRLKIHESISKAYESLIAFALEIGYMVDSEVVVSTSDSLLSLKTGVSDSKSLKQRIDTIEEIIKKLHAEIDRVPS